MSDIINIVCLQFLVVYFVELAQYWKLPTSIINFFLTKRFQPFQMKPLSCSFCTMFWVGLIYLIITSNFTIPYLAFISLLSFLTRPLYELLCRINDILIKIINYDRREKERDI